MGYEESKAEAKREELEALIADALRAALVDHAEPLAREVTNQFADITAPYLEPPTIHWMALQEGGIGGGSTTKPGNVILNFGKLVRAIASGLLTITGAMATPWTLVIGALVTWDQLWSSLRIEITEDQACVAWVLWTMREADGTVAKDDVLDGVTRERQRFGKPPLSEEEVGYALRDLCRMRCIEQSSRDPERWWLREWVRVKFT